MHLSLCLGGGSRTRDAGRWVGGPVNSCAWLFALNSEQAEAPALSPIRPRLPAALRQRAPLRRAGLQRAAVSGGGAWPEPRLGGVG